MPVINSQIAETVDITTNGQHNVSQYTTANVAVDPSIESLSISATTSEQTITAPTGTDGYSPITVAPVTAAIDANITAGNIKKDVTILGVIGSYEGSGGDVDTMMENKYGIEVQDFLDRYPYEIFVGSGMGYDVDNDWPSEEDPETGEWIDGYTEFNNWFGQTNGWDNLRIYTTQGFSVTNTGIPEFVILRLEYWYGDALVKTEYLKDIGANVYMDQPDNYGYTFLEINAIEGEHLCYYSTKADSGTQENWQEITQLIIELDTWDTEWTQQNYNFSLPISTSGAGYEDPYEGV